VQSQIKQIPHTPAQHTHVPQTYSITKSNNTPPPATFPSTFSMCCVFRIQGQLP
jgi:hypothetical protein